MWRHCPFCLKRLHLSAMAPQWEAFQEEASANHWTLAQYLTVLGENAVAHRHTQRLQRYCKESHLPAAKTLSQFDFGSGPKVNSTRLGRLLRRIDR
jgi:DNA replication protein DnaC